MGWRGRPLRVLQSRARRAALLYLLPCAAFWACGRAKVPSDDTARVSASPGRAPADTDDFGSILPHDASFAERVVSLNPTATEVIFAMGAESHLVGRSVWDLHPDAAKAITAVGNGIRPNVEAVLQQHPTLVILYATADNRAAAEAFARAGVRTVALRVDHIAQFVALTRYLGTALGAVDRASAVVDSVQRTLARIREVTRAAPVRSVVWPMWQQPVLVVGRGSYLDELIELSGGRNVFHDLEAPSPPVSVEEIARRNPDVVVTTERGRAMMTDKPQWRAVRAVRDGHWVIDDPEITGRPSVVLGMAANALARALHPELASQLPTLRAVTP